MIIFLMVFRNYIKNRSTNNEIVPVLVLSFCKYLIFNVVCSGYENTEKYSHIFHRPHILY
nr:MAG TPA: hypothetical protein [Caudoviricetes sp.]